MQTIDPKAILLILVEVALVYLFAAMIAADGWVIYRRVTGRPVLPPSSLVTRRPVPWGAWTVLLAVLMFLVLTQVVFLGYLKLNGLLPSKSQARLLSVKAQNPAAKPDGKQSPPDQKAQPEAKQADGHVAPVNVPPAEKSKQATPKPKAQPTEPRNTLSSKNELTLSYTENLVIGSVSDVMLLCLLPFLLRRTSRSPLRDLGLSFDKWWLQAAIGVFAFLAIEPLLLAVQFGAARLWESNPHPLLKMVQHEFSPGVPQLAILLAVFIAPVCEEVLFRGIIQSWLCASSTVFDPSLRRSCPRAWPSRRGKPCSAPSFAHSQAGLSEPPAKHDFRISLDLPSGPSPETPVTTVDQTLAANAGIVTTSLIFAALHWGQWPAPIPIFFLAVVIGYVYQRTGSLIAAICMHAMFNGLSVLFLMGLLLVPQSAQKPDAKTVKPPAIVAGFSGPSRWCVHSLGKIRIVSRIFVDSWGPA